MTTPTRSLETATLAGDELIRTPIGDIELRHSYFDDDASRRLFDEMDYQRACQAYVWSTPLVSITAWRDAQTTGYGVTGETDFVVFDSLKEKRGIVTANLTTPYILNFISLAGGPLEIAYPAGQTAGGVLDFWQRPVCDTRPDRAGPGEGRDLHHRRTRTTTPPRTAARASTSSRARPTTSSSAFGSSIARRASSTRVKQQLTMAPRGPARRDRAASSSARTSSGTRPRRAASTTGASWPASSSRSRCAGSTRPGPPCCCRWASPRARRSIPTQRQQRILLDGAAMGELMTRNLQVNPRYVEPYWKNTYWYKCFDFTIPQETETRVELDERATWFYEAVTSSEGMVNPVVGAGQVYMTTKRDSKGNTAARRQDLQAARPEGRPRRPILVVDAVQREHPPAVRQRRHRDPQHRASTARRRT